MSSNADGKRTKILGMSKWAARLFTSMIEALKAWIRVIIKSQEVFPITIAPGLQDAKHVLVTVVHNEASRIPFMLDYYRAMGFEHFIVLDNRSEDDLQKILSGKSGVSVFMANGSFRSSRFGVDWMNGILARYCSQKWVLYVDADEFFVFPHCDTKNISDLTEFMESNGQHSLQCMMLDMYSDKRAEHNICGSDEDPLSVCRLYDRNGYFEKYDALNQTVWIKGGVRGRIYFSHNVWEGPALNKTPLVFWKRHYAFLRATHLLWPPQLNGGTLAGQKLRGVLLHFKFLSDWTTKVARESVRRQHTDEYKAYSTAMTSMDDGPDFVGSPTGEYQSWRSLEQDGLLDGNAWPI